MEFGEVFILQKAARFTTKDRRMLKGPGLIPRDYIYLTSKIVSIEGRKICSKKVENKVCLIFLCIYSLTKHGLKIAEFWP